MTEQNQVIDRNKFFDFDKERVQSLTLEQLTRTHKEVDVYGNPIKGVHHFELINNILGMCHEFGYDSEVYDLFAANNRDRTQPGVVKLPAVEAISGVNSVESHILRRVYANVRLKDFDDEETTTNLAIAFHQRGIQVGFGPNVRICHNQCMMSPQLYIATYSDRGQRGTGADIQKVFSTVREWLENARNFVMADRERIERMKNTQIAAEQMFLLIGMLTAIRVKADSTKKEIRENITYPLNQSQINALTEDMLVAYHDKNVVTAWDLYNSATNMYKAHRMDVPAILPQNRAMVEFLHDQLGV